jgi:hypothetical protein
MWALAKLGEHTQHFEQLPEDRRQAVLHVLEEEAAGGDADRAGAAQAALAVLHGKLQGLDAVFAKCAADADPFLRKTTALALNFWNGNTAENARLDDILAQLAQDDGRTQGAGPELAEALEIRKNATAALARRGSDRADLNLLREMLDEDRQRQDYRALQKDTPQAVQDAARAIVLSTLKAVAELHRKNPGRDLSSLDPAIEQLTHNPAASVRAEAEQARQALRSS